MFAAVFSSFTYFLPLATDPPAQDTASQLLTAVISGTVIAAIISAGVTLLINWNNNRVAQRRNEAEGENDLVNQYREAAAEERAQKESAVETVRKLLEIAQDQVASLKESVKVLNDLLITANEAANTQKDLIAKLTSERDRNEAALTKALAQIAEQKEELLRRQSEILELTYPKDVVDKLRAFDTDSTPTVKDKQ